MSKMLYNVTVKIDHSAHESWLTWMQQVHIPDVMRTRCFYKSRICRLYGLEEEDGVTYAIQYECSSPELLRKYQEKHAARLQSEHMDKFANRFVAFRTILEVLSAYAASNDENH